MRTIEIVITGPKVVEVGYRAFLLINAVTIGLERVFAYNDEEGVVVRIGGADDEIDRYVDFVKSNFPLHAQVDAVEVREFEGYIMEALLFMQLLQFELIRRAVTVLTRGDGGEASRPENLRAGPSLDPE